MNNKNARNSPASSERSLAKPVTISRKILFQRTTRISANYSDFSTQQSVEVHHLLGRTPKAEALNYREWKCNWKLRTMWASTFSPVCTSNVARETIGKTTIDNQARRIQFQETNRIKILGASKTTALSPFSTSYGLISSFATGFINSKHQKIHNASTTRHKDKVLPHCWRNPTDNETGPVLRPPHST